MAKTKAELEKQIAELEAKNEALEKGIKEGKAAIPVPGEYTAADGAIYKFKDGMAKTRNAKSEIVDSTSLLEDAEYMEHLIKISYGGLELVKEAPEETEED